MPSQQSNVKPVVQLLDQQDVQPEMKRLKATIQQKNHLTVANEVIAQTAMIVATGVNAMIVATAKIAVIVTGVTVIAAIDVAEIVIAVTDVIVAIVATIIMKLKLAKMMFYFQLAES
jgi:hypothetical protein